MVERRRDGGNGSETDREAKLARQLLEMKVLAELQGRDLEASGIGYRALLDARLRVYLFEDDSALAEVMMRLEEYRRRYLN